MGHRRHRHLPQSRLLLTQQLPQESQHPALIRIRHDSWSEEDLNDFRAASLRRLDADESEDRD
jgi:hypothetical protein